MRRQSVVTGAAGKSGGHGDRDRARNCLRMSVRHNGRDTRLGGRSVMVI
jgi:hypothetical protein